MPERIEKNERLGQRPLIVGMVGCLGSGKTTLAGELGRRWGITPIEENYPANPFLKNFYKNLSASGYNEYSLKSQIFFLTSKIEQLKQIENHASIIDPSLTMDYCYAKTHFKLGWMDEHEWNLYNTLYYTLIEQSNVVFPDVHIAVTADHDDLQKRILSRGRDYEMSIIERVPGYLSKLDEAVLEWASGEKDKSYVFIANTSGNNLKDSVNQLSNRIESHMAAKFLGKLKLPNFPVREFNNNFPPDIVPGKDSESTRLQR